MGRREEPNIEEETIEYVFRECQGGLVMVDTVLETASKRRS